MGKNFEDIDSLTTEVIGKNEEWEELNGYLRGYGSQRFEQHWQSEKKKYPHQDQLSMMIIKTEMMMTTIYKSKIGFFAESS